MRIAEQKLKENIAEYVLYMFQIEDIIRAYQFDVDRIMEHYVHPQLPDEMERIAYRRWYADLVKKMMAQRLEKSGHLLELKEILLELSFLHNSLLEHSTSHYKSVFEKALPFIEEFREKSNLRDKNQIEIMFHALYMKLLLKLQGKTVSAESEEAFEAMRKVLAQLSKSYRMMKEGNADFLNN